MAGRATLPFTPGSSKEALMGEGMSAYWRSARWFFTPALDDGQVYMNSLLQRSMKIVERGRAPFIVDNASVHEVMKHLKIGQEFDPRNFNGTIPIGKLHGEFQEYSGRNNIRITKISPAANGKTAVFYEEIISANLGLKVFNATGFRGTNAGLFGKTAMKLDYMGWYDVFKKGDPGAMIKLLTGQFVAWARSEPGIRENPSRINEILNVFNKHMDPYIKAGVVNGSVHTWTLKDGADLTTTVSRDIIRKMFKMYKDPKIGLTQNKPLHEQFANSILWKREGPAGYWTQTGKDLIRGAILSQMDDPGHKEVFFEWLKYGGGMGPDDIAKVMKSYGEKDWATFDRMVINNPQLPKIWEAISVPMAGRHEMQAGIVSDLNSAILPTQPLWGTGKGYIKLSRWAIEMSQHRPGGIAYHEAMVKEIEKQTYKVAGLYSWQERINMGNYQPKALKNLSEFIDSIEKSEVNNQNRMLWKKMLDASQVKYKSLGGLREMQIFEIDNQMYTLNDVNAMSGKGLADRVQVPLGQRELETRSWRKEDVAFMRVVRDQGSGYLDIPKTRIMRTDGKFTSVTKILYTSSALEQIDVNPSTGRLGGGDHTVNSSIAQTLQNILIKARTDPRTLQSEVQKLYDLESSIGPLKGIMAAKVPGANAMLQFGVPYIDDLPDRVKDMYRKEMVMWSEGIVNVGWLKRHSRQFNESLRNTDPEVFRMISQYVKNYNQIVPGSPHKTHPMYNFWKAEYEKTFAGQGKKYNDLLFDMSRASNKMDMNSLRKEYFKAVEAGTIPTPGVFIKAPLTTTKDSAPAMFLFRPLNLKSGAAETVVRMDALTMKMANADTDAD